MSHVTSAAVWYNWSKLYHDRLPLYTHTLSWHSRSSLNLGFTFRSHRA